MGAIYQRLLEAQIDRNQVHPPTAAIKGDYLEGAYVIQKLNELTGMQWSSEVKSAEQVTLPSGSVMFRVWGSIRVTGGDGSIIERYDGGSGIAHRVIRQANDQDRQPILKRTAPNGKEEYIFPPNDEAYETAYKTAFTDFIKRCARQLSLALGLALYMDENALAAFTDEDYKPNIGDNGASDSQDPSDFLITFGKYKDNPKTLGEIAVENLGYIDWLAKEADKPNPSKAAIAAKELQKMMANLPPIGTQPPASAQPPSTIPEGDKIVGNLGNRDTFLKKITELAKEADWDDLRLVGHIGKHFGYALTSGVDGVPKAVFMLKVAQAKTLRDELSTIIELRKVVKEGGFPDPVIIAWCNTHVGTTYTNRKSGDNAIQELPHENRVALLAHLKQIAKETAALPGDVMDGEDEIPY